jgi:gluconokinase
VLIFCELSRDQRIIVVVMGVSGSGKTAVGRPLAQRLGWSFYEGDAFHSAANTEKMSAGIPRIDADRWPWLADSKNAIDRSSVSGTNAVFAYSALRDTNRCYLAADVPEIRFV